MDLLKKIAYHSIIGINAKDIMSNNGQKRKIYCCNCGKLGHVLRNCLEPIISLGIILFYKDRDAIKFLMIRRKFSLGFMEFMLGKYSVNNLEYIYRMFNEMTIEEKVRIMSDTFDELWFSIDYNRPDFDSDNLVDDYRKKLEQDYNTSKRKFYLLKHGYINKFNQYVNLYQIVKNLRHNWIEQEWEFPKGKRKLNESNLDAALREFSEETNYPLDKIDIILTDYPILEKYYGSNGKKYKHIYFLARANEYINCDTLSFTEFQDVEISDIQWMTYNEAMNSIRPYHIEKKMVLNNILQQIIQYYIDESI